MKERHRQHTSFFFAAVGCVDAWSGLLIRRTEEKSYHQKIHQDELHDLGGTYSHFAILLKDVVCLFRIYVHQSGNKGLAIAQTVTRESVGMLAQSNY